MVYSWQIIYYKSNFSLDMGSIICVPILVIKVYYKKKKKKKNLESKTVRILFFVWMNCHDFCFPKKVLLQYYHKRALSFSNKIKELPALWSFFFGGKKKDAY